MHESGQGRWRQARRTWMATASAMSLADSEWDVDVGIEMRGQRRHYAAQNAPNRGRKHRAHAAEASRGGSGVHWMSQALDEKKQYPSEHRGPMNDNETTICGVIGSPPIDLPWRRNCLKPIAVMTSIANEAEIHVDERWRARGARNSQRGLATIRRASRRDAPRAGRPCHRCRWKCLSPCSSLVIEV